MIKRLSFLGRITTPAAMVVFMAYEINRSMAVEGFWGLAVLLGSILTAVGVEIVGILSGSTLEGFWRQGKTARAVISFGLLLIYTGAAVFILRANSTLWAVPIVAAVVYIVSAMADSMESEEQALADERLEDVAWEREREAEQARREHEARLRKQELEARVKIERARAKAASPASNVATISPSVSRQIPSDWRQLTDRQKQELAGLSPVELMEKTDISQRTAERWSSKLSANGWGNGHG